MRSLLHPVVVALLLAAPTVAYAGDAKHGAVVFDRACSSCHTAHAPRTAQRPKRGERIREQREFRTAPDLVRKASKTGLARVATWLNDPRQLKANPACDLRRMDASEHGDLIAFLDGQLRASAQTRKERRAARIQEEKAQKARTAPRKETK